MLTEKQQRNQMIAATILAQLGGKGRIESMIGGKYFSAGDNYLSFQFPKGQPGFNGVKITLNEATDLYDVTFYKIRGTKFTTQEHTSIDAENLKSLFERVTGLYLSL